MRLDRQKIALKLFSEKIYKCTADGDIISLSCKHGARKTPRALKGVNHNGYLRFGLMYDGHRYYFGAHQLVWLFFNGGYNPQLQINHKDGVKKNNHPCNLELMTAQANIIHAFELGLSSNENSLGGPNMFGETNPNAKLDPCKVKKIRKLYPRHSAASIGVMFGVTRETIWSVVTGRTWGHVK